jgi:hypothetical protein
LPRRLEKAFEDGEDGEDDGGPDSIPAGMLSMPSDIQT